MAELKPCPFCGKDAKYTTNNGLAYVRCSGLLCGANGPTVIISDEYIAKDIAIEKWNTRANEKGGSE